ncbi:MAG: SDR family oxidoreductase [Chroococcidiopsidaceae cyanobacterium CP_BM_ER_R8_30]|nr:SDR family oxidoreductase [Chroococcidiopsidaceae cyanobacterium CP_BM_ER_R8_30]
MSLENKVVVITGGGTGIGAETAQSFYKAGAKVVLNGRRKDKLSQIAAKIDPSAKHLTYFAGDIGQPQTSQQIVELAIARFGKVDILVNNAGVFHAKPFLNHTEEEVNIYLNLVRGYFFMSQAAIAAMRQQGGGAIVNIGSILASQPSASTPASASSTAKGAVHALTLNLATEFAPQNIRVNAIAPAVVETPLWDSLLTAAQLASLGSSHPLGRNGQARDITEAVLFLADDSRSSWITGVVLPVDGGVGAGRN